MSSIITNPAATSTPVPERTAQKRAARKAPAKKATAKRAPASERPASDRQVNRIGTLLAERDTSKVDRLSGEGATHTDDLTSAAASAIIDALIAAPFQEGREPSPVGFYVRDRKMYQVVANKAGTSTYAKRLVVRAGRGAWEYDPEAGRAFGPKPLTAKRARDLAVKAGLSTEGADKLFA
jgi:hypothetical protein